MNTTLLACKCSSVEHQIVIYHNEDDNLVYCLIHLSKRSFWKRLVHGIKYIFGYKSKYGHWDEFIFNSNDAQKVLEIYKTLTNGKKKS